MKRILSLALSLALLLALSVPALAAGEAIRPTKQNLTVDGAAQICEIYNIGGSNYFKLRDIAYLLNGTGSQFAVGWDGKTKTVTVTTGAPYEPNGTELVMRTLTDEQLAAAGRSQQTILINGQPDSSLDAYLIGGSNFFKLRALGDALGFDVGYDTPTKTMLVESRGKAQTGDDPVTHKLVQLEGVTAHVMTVDVANPRVRLEVGMVDHTVAARAPFKDIVDAAGSARAVITGNFMNGDSEGNFPVGHVMRNGELLYIGSGFTTVGITESGEVRFGRPSVRVMMRPTARDCTAYTALAMNLRENEQASQFSVLYTPAFGQSFEVTDSGSVTTVRAGKVAAYRDVAPGERIDIPADGYVLWLGDVYMREFVWSYEPPQVGEGVALEYYLDREDAEGFTLDGVTQMISGAPRLLKNGADETEIEPQFSGDRFSDDYSAPRTALGVTADGKLIFVSAVTATIPKLRALMRALGCVNAVNLDGGASTAFYYNDGKGDYVLNASGRNLATTVAIYVD